MVTTTPAANGASTPNGPRSAWETVAPSAVLGRDYPYQSTDSLMSAPLRETDRSALAPGNTACLLKL